MGGGAGTLLEGFFEVADDECAAWVVDTVKGLYNGLIIICYLTVLKLVGGGVGR
jgi:hypothetical protein